MVNLKDSSLREEMGLSRGEGRKESESGDGKSLRRELRGALRRARGEGDISDLGIAHMMSTSERLRRRKNRVTHSVG